MDEDIAPASPSGSRLPRNAPFSGESAPGTSTSDRSGTASPGTTLGATIGPHGGDPAVPGPGATAIRAEVAASDATDRTGVFERLVKGDGDIAGLVAYSIYKQNKLDWLRAFAAAKGRPPGEDELSSYIIGEGTLRRLATYRHLAEATLAGNGPDVDGRSDPGGSRLGFGRRGAFADRRTLTMGLIATYAFIACLFVAGFWLAAHFTMASR